MQNFIDYFAKLKVKSHKKLEEYLRFCEENKTEYIKFKTARHHILPKAPACFPEFEDFSTYPWNRVILTHQNHYVAHYLLAQAISNVSINAAWWAMKIMDVKNGRLSTDFIKEESKIFQQLMEEKHAFQILDNNTITENGKTKKENQTEKMIQTRKKNGSSLGEKNPAYGKKWMHKGNKDKFISAENVDEFLKDGWYLGYSGKERKGYLRLKKAIKRNLQKNMEFFKKS